ncbi:MAG TPA: hypothetical protein PKE55_07510 [Kiritimatiellia bacterium]|nr:hypothetical protein [Kiritimatiellia bacterium]
MFGFSDILRRLVMVLLVAGLGLANQIHLPLLQAVGWAGMLVEFSRSDGLPEAVKKTFNGENPCELCLLVEEQASDPQKAWFTFDVSRLLLFAEAEAGWRHDPGSSRNAKGDAMMFRERVDVPEVPPPRGQA